MTKTLGIKVVGKSISPKKMLFWEILTNNFTHKRIYKFLNANKKKRKIFSSFDFRFEISAKISFKKRSRPNAHISKKFPYGTAALCRGNNLK